mgnify:CR=1 FL=1
MSKPSSARGPGLDAEKKAYIEAILKMQEGATVYQQVSFKHFDLSFI